MEPTGHVYNFNETDAGHSNIRQLLEDAGFTYGYPPTVKLNDNYAGQFERAPHGFSRIVTDVTTAEGRALDQFARDKL